MFFYLYFFLFLYSILGKCGLKCGGGLPIARAANILSVMANVTLDRIRF